MVIEIDGSYGEGGGQVLRTSLALSCITGQPLRIESLRAGRRKPGLRPQHLTAVRAAAKVCDAKVEGARLNSRRLTFTPRSEPRAGTYTFDVAQVAKGGSAGSASLVLQTVLLPLALATDDSRVTVRGGTHVPWSPPFDYLKRVYLPVLARLGVAAKVRITKWGWYPTGGGEIIATIQGGGKKALGQGLDLSKRGELVRVRGVSAASNLPKHIRVRQERAALQVLRAGGVSPRVDVVDAPSRGMGTVVFLWAECENAVAGFTSLGEKGKPAEQVAEQAAEGLLNYLASSAALDPYLADQVMLPMALAEGPSQYTTQRVTHHLATNAWVVNQFFPGCVRVEGAEGEPGICWISGQP